jgi:hypothetical protein
MFGVGCCGGGAMTAHCLSPQPTAVIASRQPAGPGRFLAVGRPERITSAFEVVLRGYFGPSFERRRTADVEGGIGMVDNTIKLSRAGWFGRLATAALTIATVTAVLCLDGGIGPLSFTLRRAIALAILALVAAFTIVQSGGWRMAGWAGVVAALVLLARAPSVPIALIWSVPALAAIEIGVRRTPPSVSIPDSSAAELGAASPFPIGLVQSCLTYVALERTRTARRPFPGERRRV